jgi:hypothetical protein
LRQREDDRRNSKEDSCRNTREMVLPYLDRMRRTRNWTENSRNYLDIVVSNLNEIVSPFLTTLGQRET